MNTALHKGDDRDKSQIQFKVRAASISKFSVVNQDDHELYEPVAGVGAM